MPGTTFVMVISSGSMTAYEQKMRRHVCVALTVCAFHLAIVACFYEANVSQVEDTRNDLQHLRLDVTWDPNHLHGLLKNKSKKKV